MHDPRRARRRRVGVRGAACGEPPYVDPSGTTLAYPEGLPLAGVELTFDLCSDVVATSDLLGGAAVRMQKFAKYVATARAEGSFPLRTGEQLLQTDFVGGAPMFPTRVGDAFPHLSAESPAILAIVNARTDRLAADDPCATRDGVVFSVVLMKRRSSRTSPPRPTARCRCPTPR